MLQSRSGMRLPPHKHQSLALNDWEDPTFGSAAVEAGAAESLRAMKELGGSSFGTSRRMVIKLQEEIKSQRKQAAREAAFTLDCVGSATGEYVPSNAENNDIYL